MNVAISGQELTAALIQMATVIRVDRLLSGREDPRKIRNGTPTIPSFSLPPTDELKEEVGAGAVAGQVANLLDGADLPGGPRPVAAVHLYGLTDEPDRTE